MKVFSIAFVIAAIGLATPTLAQMPQGSKGDQESPQSFVNKAAQGGMTEVELGKLASSKTKSPDIKRFADRMVEDHGQANIELQAVAKTKNLQVPKELDAEHRSMVEKLSGKSGAEFDSSYAEHMVTNHTKSIALFEGGSRSEDSDVAAFAKKTLPTIKEHKQMADSLKANTRGTGSDAP